MRVLHVTPYFAPAFRYGGPPRSIFALCRHLQEQGVDVEVLTTTANGVQDLPQEVQRKGYYCGINVRYLSRRFPKRYFYAAGLSGVLQDAIAHSDLIHIHGIWNFPSHLAARHARALGRPYLLSPRGMLTVWARTQKSLQKRVAWSWQVRRDFLSARVLHVTSDQEADELPENDRLQNVMVVPNGVDAPRSLCHAERSKEPREVLFLSRIHPKKGILDLISAWHEIRPAGWRVIVAGPDEGSYASVLKAEVSRLAMTDCFEFHGMVDGVEKERLFKRASLFVLPTYSENFGIAVPEALAAGVPVVTTRAAPWSLLETNRCGWWIETGMSPLAKALAAATGISDEQRMAMGERGRQVVRERFQWQSVAQQMKQVYHWMLQGGDCPVRRWNSSDSVR